MKDPTSIMTNTQQDNKTESETRFENLDKLDYSQSFNEVRYTCQDCENVWNTSEYLGVFLENSWKYNGYVTSEWHKIFRSVHENLFRPKHRLYTTVCPQCSAEHERKAGNIEASYHGQKTDKDTLKEIARTNKNPFEQALKKLFTVGKRVNSNGKVVEIQ